MSASIVFCHSYLLSARPQAHVILFALLSSIPPFLAFFKYKFEDRFSDCAQIKRPLFVQRYKSVNSAYFRKKTLEF